MNFSAYSIKNPLVAILFFALLTIGGLLGFQRMKVQQFPDIDFPGIVVTVGLPGASPAQLESDIAKKLENKISNIEGIKHMRTVLQTGAATVNIEFELGKDVQVALDDVRTAVGEVQGDLPAAANDPIISKVSIAGYPVLTYTVAADNMSTEDLSWFVDDTINKRLSDVEGVGQIARIGGVNRIVSVEVKPDRLNALKMPINQLSQQISGIQKDTTGGEAKIGDRTQSIRVLGSVDSANDLKNIQIAVTNGETESLSSLATIIDGADEPSSIAKMDDKVVVAFNVSRTRGASEVDMAKLVDAELAQLQKDMPHISVDKVYDTATPVEEDYQASMQMLIEGGVLAVIVVLIFLRNIRATIVAAVALPLSVIPTFLGMWLFDFSLNIISLLALSLVIGVLVDDAIVEVENIIRHLRMGKSPYEAAMEAADEIGLAVIATTFTLIAVFLPTAFMGGVVGQFFKQFGWTAAISIFASLLVARLITPMMAAYFLKPEKQKEEKTGWVMQKYLAVVRWTLKHRMLTIALTTIFFVFTLSLAKYLPSTFIPENDIDLSRVNLVLTPDSSLEDTARITEIARQRVSEVEGVEHVMSAVGQPQTDRDGRNAGAGSQTNQASLDIDLAPRGQRPSKTEIEQQISEIVKEIPGARFTVGLSSGGESGYNFQLTSSNGEVLEQTAQKIMEEIRQLNTAGSVTSNKSIPTPELSIIPDRLAMADKGVTTQAIADTLRVATMGDYDQLLSKLNLDSRQIPIIVRLPKEAKQNITQMSDLYVASSNIFKDNVRIGDVASLSFNHSASEIRRFDRERAIRITALPNGKTELGGFIGEVKKTPTFANLPSSITVIEEGQAESMGELFEGFKIAMGIGVICIFGVLMLLFHRVLQPFTILMALPLSVGGAIVGLLLTGSSLSMPSMIGLIMLMGIATKNSILLVDYAIIAQREYQLPRFEALVDACHKRARPIVMTTIAMGAGMLPLILGLSGADPTFRQPMAAAVLGGLVTSTFLSLVVIPVVYTFMDDLSNFTKSIFK